MGIPERDGFKIRFLKPTRTCAGSKSNFPVLSTAIEADGLGEGVLGTAMGTAIFNSPAEETSAGFKAIASFG